jgi:peroxiredoxin
MKKLLLAALLGLELSACGRADQTDSSRSAPAPPSQPLVVTPRDTITGKALAPPALPPARVEALTKDYATWYRYAYYHVPLFRDFKALDTAGQLLPKKAFLRQLATGKVLALLNGNEHQRPVYQLYPYAGQQREIRSVSQQLAEQELSYVEREGTPLPAFRFTDLQGKMYTPATTHGKVLVLKSWFIKCGACVQEFPEVNALVTRYQQNKDVLFISLANDKADKLRDFLLRKPLHYAVIPDSEEYTEEELQIHQYPTHLVVGRDGKIAHVTNSVRYLAAAIDAALKPARAAK